METKTIVEAIIIIIVVAFLIILPTKGWSIVQYIMNWDVEETIQAPSIEISNKFENIKSDYNNCFASTKNNCLCNIQIQTFPEGYFVTYDKEIIDFRKVYDKYKKGFDFIPLENSIGFKDYQSFTGKNINCYAEYDLSIGIINTKTFSKTSYLLLYAPTGIVTTEGTSTESHLFLNNIPTFYKFKNEICFVLEDKLTKEGQAYISKLPKC